MESEIVPDDELEAVPDWYEAVYEFVRRIPAGKVVTYGQAASCVTGVHLSARQVGAAMRYAPKDVPWQRVLGAGGALPIARRSPELSLLQKRLLQKEGVIFKTNQPDFVDMQQSQWHTQAGEASREVSSPEQGSLFEEI